MNTLDMIILLTPLFTHGLAVATAITEEIGWKVTSLVSLGVACVSFFSGAIAGSYVVTAYAAEVFSFNMWVMENGERTGSKTSMLFFVPFFLICGVCLFISAVSVGAICGELIQRYQRHA